MQVFEPRRTPKWVSTRRFFEQILSELHNCADFGQLKLVLPPIFKSHLCRDNVVGTKLISAFSLCRRLDSALHIFRHIHQPDVHAYNVLIRAYIRNSQPSRGFSAFVQMQSRGFRPNIFTYPFLLKAGLGLEFVTVVHALIEKCGFYEDILAPNSLIEAYSKCGLMGVRAAQKLFGQMVRRDNVSWNCMIGGLAKGGQLKEARQLFDEMPHKDIVTWNTILDGYVKSGEMNVAYELFENMPTRDSVSWSTMVLGYSKSGDMEMARNLFDKMPVKNMVAWTIIVCGYAEKGFVKEAMGLYDQMGDLKLDEGTTISILGACAESSMLGLGKRVHDFVKKSRHECSVRLSNALVNMYAKCGRLEDALCVFDGMKEQNSVSWSTMIHGLGIHGYGEQALELFSKMIQGGFAPNKVTFVGVLCACSHAGLLDDGMRYFDAMQKDYGVTPELEHYGCMIDLLGRGGCLKEALGLILNMPFKPNQVIWGAFLAACRKHYAVAIAGDELKQLGVTENGNLSLLSDSYAAAGDWTSVASARLLMKKTWNAKSPGASSVELDDEYHHFTTMDTCHPESDLIYKIIDGLNLHMMKTNNVPMVFC